MGLKTLHKYLTAQVLASLLLTVAVFTFVLLLGNVLKEILALLIAGHVRLGIVAEAIVLLIPFVWVFALPMGMLTATLLVFGRFSADQELTAARASGISLISLVMPVLLLSLCCCVLSAWFNMDLGPRSRVAYLNLRSDLEANLATLQLPEDTVFNISTNYSFYTEKNDHGKLKNVVVWLQEHGRTSTLNAPEGEYEVDSNKQLIVNLFNVRALMFLTNNSEPVVFSADKWPIPIQTESAKKAASKPAISDMTFWQLQDELRELQQRISQMPPETASTNATRLTADELRKLPENLREEVRVYLHRQIAFSFGCFGFALIGIPLGIRVHRRETNIGVAIALVLVTVYFGFIVLAQELSFHPEFFPHLIVWLPNFLFQGVGAVLLWRANRGI